MGEKIKAGTVLDNKAIVLASAPTLILAMWDRGGDVEFVTWRHNEDGALYLGQYFASLRDALDNFESRGGAIGKVGGKSMEKKQRKVEKTIEEKVDEGRVEKIHEAGDEALYECGSCGELIADPDLVQVRHCPHCDENFNGTENGRNCPECNRPFSSFVTEQGCPDCLEEATEYTPTDAERKAVEKLEKEEVEWR